MSGFVSSHQMRIDRKGRVSIPAPFRQVLARDGFEGLHCYPSLDFFALDAGGSDLVAAIERQLSAFEPFSEDHDLLSVAFWGASQHLTVDGEGRIAIPETLAEVAGLDGEVVFVGLGYKFQIWSPERFRAHRLAATDRLAALRGRRGAGSGEGAP